MLGIFSVIATAIKISKVATKLESKGYKLTGEQLQLIGRFVMLNVQTETIVKEVEEIFNKEEA